MKQTIYLIILLAWSLVGISKPYYRATPLPNPTPTAPTTANDYFQVGFNSANSGQYELAIKNYSIAISMDGSRIFFFYHRGLAYRNIGDKKSATNDFNQCISMKPIAEAYYQIGVYQYDEQNLKGAKDNFERVNALKEDLDKTNFFLGAINYRLNNFDTAEAYLTRYVRGVKTNSDAFLYLAMTKVKQHKYEEVGALLKSASLYNDNDWKLHLKMYDIYKEMGDKKNMLYNISMVIEMGQKKPEYYNIRAKLYLDQGDNLRAEYDLQTAKTISQ